MSSLKKIKDRMQSVRATQQMTASMKVVAVSRLKKKHAAFLKTIPYADEMNRVLRRLIRSMKLKQETLIWENKKDQVKWPTLLNGNGQDRHYLIVMMTSDEGLSGASALQVVQQTQKLIRYLKQQGKIITVVAYGARGWDMLKRGESDITLIRMKFPKTKGMGAYLNAERLTADIIQSFYQNRFDRCLVVYNQFKSIISQIPVIDQIVPNNVFLRENPWDFLTDRKRIGKGDLKTSSFIKAIGGVGVLSSLEGAIFKTDLSGGKRSPEVYDYEPSDNGILESILPQYLTAYVYRVILESEVSDNAARLMAMDNATRNATDMVEHLDRIYKRTRQTKITTDVAEIAGGNNL
ncbi:MAG: ATP synthase F1 subunit gamma [Pseudomonadota bacterium]|nr:ATP synthase F1 subunit gamma [Pseudomonadota bacterium]